MRLPAYAILMAGGYGTRFWPLSRRAKPKQFLALTGKDSLLQQTYRRLLRLFPPSRIYVVGNTEHRRLLKQQLPRIPAGRLLLEPLGRNTAAAVALAAEHILHANLGRDAVLGVFPADHAIRDEFRFRRIVRAALTTAGEEVPMQMVVLGIPPTHPDTGYGYIERGPRARRRNGQPVFSVRRFTEKPDSRTAARFLRTGRYYWNSGMFFFRRGAFQALLLRHLPRTSDAFSRLSAAVGSRDYRARLNQVYRRLDNISLDYALAEPAAQDDSVRVIPAEMGWSDLGTWSAVYDWRAKAKGENQLPADHFVLEARGSLVEVKSKFVAALGVDDLIVVETPDALLLCSRRSAQDVGKVVHYLEKKKLRRLL